MLTGLYFYYVANCCTMRLPLFCFLLSSRQNKTIKNRLWKTALFESFSFKKKCDRNEYPVSNPFWFLFTCWHFFQGLFWLFGRNFLNVSYKSTGDKLSWLCLYFNPFKHILFHVWNFILFFIFSTF